MADVIRVLVVDDQRDVRVLVRALLRTAAGVEVVAEAASGAEGVEARREVSPDVVVLDYHMPGLDGLDTARAMLADDPAQRIVFFSSTVDTNIRQAAAELGLAVLSKTEVNQLKTVVLEVAAAPPRSDGQVSE